MLKSSARPGAFNWSTLNNLACLQAKGDVLVLLNNDISVEHDDWLTVLVSHAIQPGVGAVGAKLLYPDGRVQHAGLSTDGSGVPVHLFRHLEGTSHGAFGMAALAREVWGVTRRMSSYPTHRATGHRRFERSIFPSPITMWNCACGSLLMAIVSSGRRGLDWYTMKWPPARRTTSESASNRC